VDFERYRLPASVRVGVLIELEGTEGAPFLVRLPSRYNREYTAAQQRAMGVSMDEDFRPDFTKVDFVRWKEARLEAFLEHCVLEMPKGMTRELLATEYRPGLEALFDQASALADMEDEEAIEVTKKLKA
jgi:hypothetical protein